MAADQFDYDWDALTASMERSRLVLKYTRQQRLEIARECAGHRFAEGGAVRPVKVNLLALYQQTMANLLIAKEPRYLVATSDQKARAAVRIEQDWLNEQCIHIGLAETGRRVVTDALYCTGIAWVALATPCDAATMNWGITAGEPVVRTVDLDDFVYDVAARQFSEATYIGHRYRCPLEVAKKLYKRRGEDLVGEDEERYNKDGDERIFNILRGTYSAQDAEEHVDLWQVYLPRHKKVVTLADMDVMKPDKNGKAQPLWKQDWIGPPWGPYLYLRLGTVPGSALGKGPMMDLMELHLDANNVHRKANNALRRMKELTIYAQQNDLDAERIRRASDGDLVPVQDPDRIKPMVNGGATVQGLLTAAEIYKGLFNDIGGNLSLLRGSAAQSRTATQDKILNQNAGGGVEAMHGEVQRFMAEVGESLLWYAHYHPELVMESEYKVPGHAGINRKLFPGRADLPPGLHQRDFPFHRAKLRLDPYSIRHRTPEERLAFVNSVVQQFTAMLPILAQQGIAMDANFLVSLFSEYGDAPELKELFTTHAPPGDDAPASGGHERTLPTNTERTYNRRDEGGQPQGPGQALGEMSGADFGAAQPSANGVA